MRTRWVLVVALAASLLLSGLGVPASAAPATPAGLTSAIEAFQPYVGQTTCDPVAKPGVKAFLNLLLAAYPDTGSDGIVRDCGTGGQSEHKEGRAFDWQVSASNATDVKHVNDLMAWLLATDRYGNKDAMFRRLGLMYMIWNKRIWKGYQADKGWQPYSGVSEHTDHVHFSFGWAGAKKATSYWTGHVAPIDYGPNRAPAPVLPTVTPAAQPSNLPVLARFGSLTLTPSSSGDAVAALQKALQRPATGTWTSDTTAAVEQFQRQQGLTVSSSWTPAAWLRLFPKPTVPFGAVEHVDPARGLMNVSGWAIDAGADVPLEVHVYVDGVYAQSTTEDQARPDITSTYTQYGAAHGYRVPVTLSDGTHQVCAYALNAPGTAGATGNLGCVTVNAQHGPVGAFESLQQTPDGIQAAGWALDGDTDSPVAVHLLVDDTTTTVVPSAETPRPDLATRFPDYSQGHGFVVPLDLSDGAHKVCVFGINADSTPGGTTMLGCRTLTVVHSSVGSLDPLATPPGSVTVSGAALDPDTAQPVNTDVYVDGSFLRRTPASSSRPAESGYAAWGDTHGFSTSLTLADGTHQVCAYALNAPGTPGGNRLLGCKSVAVTHVPTGALESTVQTADGLAVTGWALDPDTAASSAVDVAVDGGAPVETRANLSRPDVAATRPALGALHGFRVVLPDLSAGSHRVCVTLLNVSGSPGSNTALPCRSTVVRHDPVGVAPALGRRGIAVTAAGWAVDPDTTSPVDTHVYVDGKYVLTTVASATRSDIPAPWNGYGTAHGWTASLNLTAGSHKVCAYGINIGTGGNSLLGCTTTVVKHSPIGNLTSVTRRSDGVAVFGWAIDPDTTGGTTVRVTFDGKLVRLLGAVLSRADVGSAYPEYGPKHGFSTLLHPGRGRHTICATADNVQNTPGAAAGLGCRTVTV
ncbi:MAG: hypothetical protein QOJ48_2349 [Frankiales bacterium]|nr:hypothetical protein [Frankiales bacterium]